MRIEEIPEQCVVQQHSNNMPFQPGNKLSQTRKNRRGGPISKQSKEIQKAAREIAREYIEASVKPVMQTYFQLAHGRLVNKYHEGKIVGQEFEADAATTRHFIDKILPTVTKIEGKIEVPYSRQAVEAIRSTPEGRELAMKVSQTIVEKLLLEKPAIDVTATSTQDDGCNQSAINHPSEKARTRQPE